MSTVTQRLSIGYTGTIPLLKYYLYQLSSDVEQVERMDKPTLRVFKNIFISIEHSMAVVEVCQITVNLFYL